MSKMINKFKDEHDKYVIRGLVKINPKHRCIKCHRFTIFIKDKNEKKECYWCKLKSILRGDKNV